MAFNTGKLVTDGASVDIASTQTITGAKTFIDANFTLQDDADGTKKAQFQLSGITTGTMRTFTFPNVTGTMVVAEQPSPTLFSTTAAQTVNIATGGTSTGNTKAVNIGVGAASGSTTNITLGSATTGALGTLTVNSPSVAVAGVLSVGVNALSAGTLALAFATKAVATVTPNATASFTTTVPPAGTTCTLIITTSGTTSFTMTFGTGFKTTGTLATGTVTAKTFVMTFISDGTSVIECSRTVAM